MEVLNSETEMGLYLNGHIMSLVEQMQERNV